ncbi:hypothetical protein [Jejuia pallidilutea]|uniref:Uncharacterized protein n=1 Tax=Jejuia pallidilutea TaxID=504487 RepID=A0A090W5R1_9FLAO|nr:hypothetical protein [Jejuia pallidilutea]GAL71533.1 hypothetical protein JCM19302_1702 [Jejuia pallidilutea]
MALLVCRSNRLWTKADHNILDHVKGLVGEKIKFIINGVDIKEVETVLGELPNNDQKLELE